MGPLAIKSLPAADPLKSTDRLAIEQDTSTNQISVADLNVIKEGSLKILAADVLNMGVGFTPVKIIDAPGPGYYIKLINPDLFIDFNSIAYATNTSMELATDTATLAQFLLSGILQATVPQIVPFQDNGVAFPPGPTDTILLNNKAIYARVKGGNPTAGNSAITIFYSYMIKKL